MPDSPTSGLAEWFSTWHPRYRATLVKLFLFALLAGVLVYVENDALEAFTRALRSTVGKLPAGIDLGDDDAVWLDRLGQRAVTIGIGFPAFMLGAFIFFRVVRIVSSFSQRLILGRLQNQSRNDLELEVLSHLLRKDDAFFTNKPPAEILNRLSVDIGRVVDRRILQMRQVRSVLLVVGNLYFFVVQDVRLALVGVITCGLGAWWMSRLSAPLRDTDRLVLASDDEVKAHFEDLLRATAEVQVGNLVPDVRRHFVNVQSQRKESFATYQQLDARLDAAGGAANLIALVALLLVTLYYLTAQSPEAGVALVPVILKALPELWTSASAIVAQRLSIQLADTSVKRLLEYDSGADTGAAEQPAIAEPSSLSAKLLSLSGEFSPVGAGAPSLAGAAAEAMAAGAPSTEVAEPVVAPPIELTGATHQYRASSGAMQGGVVEIHSRFDPGRWVAVVGGAGAGKSTLLQLLLGRLKPQHGTVRFGDRELASLSPSLRASLLTLMPQTVSILDGTILENLLFGRPPREAGATGEGDDLVNPVVLEKSGLADLCRGKALNLLPDERDLVAGVAAERPRNRGADFASAVLDLRGRARGVLQGMGLALHPYEAGADDPQHWILEWLLSGRCDRPRVLDVLLGSAGRSSLRRFVGTSLGDMLVERGRRVLQKTHGLLSLPSYQVYSRLAPFPVDERVWLLRSSAVAMAAQEALSTQEAATLVFIALTSARAEMGGGAAADPQQRPGVTSTAISSLRVANENAAAVSSLRAALGPASQPFDVARVHPFLTWRENLIFAAVELPNTRTEQRVEQALLDLLAEHGLRDELARVGLGYSVGRAGARLSGGQRQLVALNRALMRDTPVLILDEPTSALDPQSRGRVCELLREWKQGRIVISVSHDPELVKQADEVRLVENGRLAGSGTFDELRASSASFRATLRLR